MSEFKGTPGLEELAMRCESATGADFDLTMEIARLDYDTPGGIGLGVDFDPLMWMMRRELDPVTSMDAAMMLVDEQWGYEQRRPSGNRTDHHVTIWWVPDFPGKVHGTGRTPSLALTAACLRAKALQP